MFTEEKQDIKHNDIKYTIPEVEVPDLYKNKASRFASLKEHCSKTFPST